MSGSPTCPTDDELVAFLAGRSTPDRSREIASHIAACQDCRDWLGGMRSAADAKADARSKFRLWAIVATMLGVVLIVLIVLLILAGQKMEKLASQEPPRSSMTSSSPALLRMIPERSVEPGQVFPAYRRSEELRLVRTMAAAEGSRAAIYELDPGKGANRLPVQAGEPLAPPAHRGLLFYLFVEFPKEANEKEISEFEKSMDEFVHKSQPLIVMGGVEPWLSQRRWAHQLISIEWED